MKYKSIAFDSHGSAMATYKRYNDWLLDKEDIVIVSINILGDNQKTILVTYYHTQ